MFGFLRGIVKRPRTVKVLDDVVRQRPIQCAAAIDAFLDSIAPPIADPDEVARRGQTLAKLALASAAATNEAGIGSAYPASDPETPTGTSDAIRRLVDAEREARVADADAVPNGTPSQEPFFAAQALRWALEEPRREFFADPDAYSGAKWARTVGANGRLDYFLAGMVALDPSGDLARRFSVLHEVLSATGHRLPVTPEEEASYASLQSLPHDQ